MVKVISIEVPEGLDEKDARLAIAIEAFRRELISVGKAAELAGIPLQTFIEELRKRGIPAYRYDDEEAMRELEIGTS
ncbi:MAG: UPF0175 family protein [Thermoplasmata archaeon]|nr:MAG: UPF0175 family protein [Thermoplasmata archaeon]